MSFAFTVSSVHLVRTEWNQARFDLRILLDIGCLRFVELLRIRELIIRQGKKLTVLEIGIFYYTQISTQLNKEILDVLQIY